MRKPCEGSFDLRKAFFVIVLVILIVIAVP